MMLRYLILIAAAFFVVQGAAAQGPAKPFSATGGPGCSDLVNRTDHTVRGSVRTALTPNAAGDMVRHEQNFAIPASDTWRVCSDGPFFDGGTVHLTIKTLMPVFECKTRLGGPILITALRRRDGNGYDWSATCL